MLYLLYPLHIVISLFLILVVLLQKGKGADLSVFGGGGTQAAFGARGQASLLHRLTVACFVLFIITTLSIGIFQGGDASVMGGVEGAPAEESESLDAPAGGTLPEDEGGAVVAPAEATEGEAEATDGSDDASPEEVGDDASAGDQGDDPVESPAEESDEPPPGN